MSLFHIYGRYYYRGGQGYSAEYQAVLDRATAFRKRDSKDIPAIHYDNGLNQMREQQSCAQS